MSDIHCAICSEPWDSYGVRHGDMLPWEADLFSKGAGCPCCKGERDRASADPEAAEALHLRDALDTEDPHAFDRVNATLAGAETPIPAWERPPDENVRGWCACGNVCLMRSADDGELRWETARKVGADAHWRLERDHAPEEWVDAEALDGDTDNEGAWCPRCVARCGRCRELVSATETYPEPGDEYHSPGICMGCLEQIPTCGQCGGSTENDEWTGSNGDCEWCAEFQIWRESIPENECERVSVVKGKRKAIDAVDALAAEEPGVRYCMTEKGEIDPEVYEATESA